MSYTHQMDWYTEVIEVPELAALVEANTPCRFTVTEDEWSDDMTTRKIKRISDLAIISDTPAS